MNPNPHAEKTSCSRLHETRPEEHAPAVEGIQFPVDEVWNAYPDIQVAFPPFPSIQYPEVTTILQDLQRKHDDVMELSSLGASVEGRTLWAVRLGQGERRVLAWSRQHGDEPLCTAAILNTLSFLLNRREDPAVYDILRGASLYFIPMVNPDGVHRFIRRNAMGIDINRDARHVATPEGAALIKARDDFRPDMAFTLHDMGTRKSTSSEQRLVALAVQAGPYDKSGGDNDVRRCAKRLCSRIAEAAGRFAHGHLTRYDAPFMPRAFGDSMMGWGVATCLIESGGWWEPDANEFIARLHYLAFLSGLHAAATGSEASANAAYYDTLPLDSGRPYFDITVRKTRLVDGTARPAFQTDLGINHDPFYQPVPHEPLRAYGWIHDLGDLSEDLGKVEVDGQGMVCVPGMVAVAPGMRLDNRTDTVHLGRFLEAGFTTVVGSCGPFEEARGFETWRSQFSHDALPVNFVAYESVDSLDDIFRRQGQSPAFGLLVPNCSVEARDLLAALHLFHPATHSALTAEQESLTLTADVLVHVGADPRDNRVHLLLQPIDAGKSHPQPDMILTEDRLRALLDAYVHHPDQLGVTVDTTKPAIGFFPTPPFLGGFGGGRTPAPSFLHRTLKTLHCTAEESFLMIASRLSRQPLCAFGIRESGLLHRDYRADLAFFEYNGQDDSTIPVSPQNLTAPHTVIVNGRLSLCDSKITQSNGGLLILR